ncbi:MAG: hypothetical protein IPL53_23815 [Ignavibacteria bacterium]|nr:hypothetical protein [Ignavibacteria bacterium]
MKKQLIIFNFLILLLAVNLKSYSQISEGIYNNEHIKYYTNKLILAYKTDSVNHSSYIDRANEFIFTHGASIDSLYSAGRYSVVEITLLSFNSDALNYIDVFINSSVFQFVSFNGVIEPDGFDFDLPNDSLFRDQWYLRQERDSGDPNHDLDADKAWTITKGNYNRAIIFNVDFSRRCCCSKKLHEEI